MWPEWATSSDQVLDLLCDFIESLPRATFAVLDRASHFLSIEQNALMKALIDEWLDRVEGGRQQSE